MNRHIKRIFIVLTAIWTAPVLMSSTQVEVTETYFLGDRFERHTAKDSGKLVASYYEGSPFKTPIQINEYDSPDLLDIYLDAMAPNFSPFNFNFFNHPPKVKITSVKQWVSSRLKYHIEKVKKNHLMGDQGPLLSEEGQVDIKRIADSIPNNTVKNIFLHSLLNAVYQMNFRSPEYYRHFARFLKSIGYSNNPVGFTNTAHCQILARSLSAVNYCFDDKSILETYVAKNHLQEVYSEGHVTQVRDRNQAIIDIFNATLDGLELEPDQVLCEDFNNRVFSKAQALQTRPYYVRVRYSEHIHVDYFVVSRFLTKFLVGETDRYRSSFNYREGFYATIHQNQSSTRIALTSYEARESYKSCVENEASFYQDNQ